MFTHCTCNSVTSGVAIFIGRLLCDEDSKPLQPFQNIPLAGPGAAGLASFLRHNRSVQHLVCSLETCSEDEVGGVSVTFSEAVKSLKIFR